MAAALLANELNQSRVEAIIRSVGVHAQDHAPATEAAVTVMRERGLDISAHRSRLLEPRYVHAADLIVGMTREHVREVVVLDPTAVTRSFTLKELVRRSQQQPRHGGSLSAWTEALTTDRDLDELLGSSDADDVADPIGRPVSKYRATAQELEDLTRQLVRAVWGSV